VPTRITKYYIKGSKEELDEFYDFMVVFADGERDKISKKNFVQLYAALGVGVEPDPNDEKNRIEHLKRTKDGVELRTDTVESAFGLDKLYGIDRFMEALRGHFPGVRLLFFTYYSSSGREDGAEHIPEAFDNTFWTNDVGDEYFHDNWIVEVVWWIRKEPGCGYEKEEYRYRDSVARLEDALRCMNKIFLGGLTLSDYSENMRPGEVRRHIVSDLKKMKGTAGVACDIHRIERSEQ